MTDYVLQWMKRNGIPLTFENYLSIQYLGQPPELDGELLEEFHDVFAELDRVFLESVGVAPEPLDEE